MKLALSLRQLGVMASQSLKYPQPDQNISGCWSMNLLTSLQNLLSARTYVRLTRKRGAWCRSRDQVWIHAPLATSPSIKIELPQFCVRSQNSCACDTATALETYSSVWAWLALAKKVSQPVVRE